MIMKNDEKQKVILFFIGAIAAAWLGLLAAPYIGTGLLGVLGGLGNALSSPFHI